MKEKKATEKNQTHSSEKNRLKARGRVYFFYKSLFTKEHIFVVIAIEFVFFVGVK